MTYLDPLDAIWLDAARRLGWRVVRDDAVFASWDGAGTLTICTEAGFDPDDCLAQMILHEICHAIVQAPGGLERPDWGLENIDGRDLEREYDCHRLQAALTAPHGLRDVLQPTTEHRSFYLALPDDPFEKVSRETFFRARQEPWHSVLQDALAATSALARAVADRAPSTIWDRWVDRSLSVEDCRECGACCHRGFHRVEVEADEDIPGTITDDFGRHLPRPDGVCVHLEERGNTCRIYERRPRSCRDLEIGGSACREARRRAYKPGP